MSSAIRITKVNGKGAAVWQHATHMAFRAGPAEPMTWVDSLLYVLGTAVYAAIAVATLLFAVSAALYLFGDGQAAETVGQVAALASTTPTLVKQTVHRAEVRREGRAIILPEGMSYAAAKEALTAKEHEEEQPMGINRTMSVFPWEGARAFRKAVEKITGLTAEGITTYSFWEGPQPPQEITVETGPNPEDRITVPWGKFSFLGAEEIPAIGREHLVLGYAMTPEGLRFAVTGVIKKKHSQMITDILDLTERLAVAESIYRGKAVRMRFNDDDGDTLDFPEIKFLDLADVNPEAVVFNRDIEDIIEANIFSHIKNRKELKKLGVPFKMGALFAGKYGTGKSLVARAIAKVATDAGVTFIYIKNSNELAKALQFGMQYQPAVVFAEDVDRVIHGDDDADGRSQAVSDIVNLLDGIDSKSSDIMVILTTNYLNRINKVLLRPGRIDLAVHIELPDADAIDRLLWLYAGKNVIDPKADLSESAAMLVGHTPAVIREVVERAKRTMVARTLGNADAFVLASDVRMAAISVVQQSRLIEGEDKPKLPTLAEAIKYHGDMVALAIAQTGGYPDDVALSGASLPAVLGGSASVRIQAGGEERRTNGSGA